MNLSDLERVMDEITEIHPFVIIEAWAARYAGRGDKEIMEETFRGWQSMVI